MNKTLKALMITTILIFIAITIGAIIDDNHFEFFVNGIFSLIVTYVAYFAYPFIRTKLMHVKYNKKTCNRMAIWNSVIVGFFFLVVSGGGAVAFIYYFFNRNLWVSDDATIEEEFFYKDIDTKETFETSKCPYCNSELILIRGKLYECENCHKNFKKS